MFSEIFNEIFNIYHSMRNNIKAEFSVIGYFEETVNYK